MDGIAEDFLWVVRAYGGIADFNEWAETGGQPMNYTMSAEIRSRNRGKLTETGIAMVNYGVVSLPNDEVECREVFEFAKETGIETLTAEPPDEAFELIDRLANEYAINVAIHYHPMPLRYRNYRPFHIFRFAVIPPGR